ncbi:hypothetical protein PSCLAVI8L_60059 [Pseudoclavibacter sp. 8L]|nr:hypothetical protein PSCLAVI8L_60059 [Pseudoclavibacter sp. 8L]
MRVGADVFVRDASDLLGLLARQVRRVHVVDHRELEASGLALADSHRGGDGGVLGVLAELLASRVECAEEAGRVSGGEELFRVGALSASTHLLRGTRVEIDAVVFRTHVAVAATTGSVGNCGVHRSRHGSMEPRLLTDTLRRAPRSRSAGCCCVDGTSLADQLHPGFDPCTQPVADCRPLGLDDGEADCVSPGAVRTELVTPQHPLPGSTELGKRRLRTFIAVVDAELDSPEAHPEEVVEEHQLRRRVHDAPPHRWRVGGPPDLRRFPGQVDATDRRRADGPPVLRPAVDSDDVGASVSGPRRVVLHPVVPVSTVGHPSWTPTPSGREHLWHAEDIAEFRPACRARRMERDVPAFQDLRGIEMHSLMKHDPSAPDRQRRGQCSEARCEFGHSGTECRFRFHSLDRPIAFPAKHQIKFGFASTPIARHVDDPNGLNGSLAAPDARVDPPPPC